MNAQHLHRLLRVVPTLLTLALILFGGAFISAQPSDGAEAENTNRERNARREGRRRAAAPQLTDEQAAAAQAQQVRTVAGWLELDETNEAALLELYSKARGALAARIAKLRAEAREGGGDRRAVFGKMTKATAEERATFAAALADLLEEDQIESVAESLGQLDSANDQMVHVLLGFELSDEDLAVAVGDVLDYNSQLSKAREDAMAAGEFGGMREKQQALRTDLDEGLADLLTEDQLAAWKEQTAQRRGGFGGGFGGGRGGNRGERQGRPGRGNSNAEDSTDDASDSDEEPADSTE